MRRLLQIMAISVVAATSARGSYFDVIGVTALRATTNLDGSGISVGQAEASDSTTTNNVFEVNPAAVSQPTNLFTYFISNPPYLTFSSSTNYTNPLGVESGHADDVGLDFYGPSGGVATNVEHVDNYQADGFYGYNIAGGHAIGERIVNQSFTFGTNDPTLDQNYDNYAAQHGVLFITGAGFPGGPIYSPATCYNGIGVSVTGVSNPLYGPTPDGRSKPDICAPGPQGAETSYSTPLVAGAATLLMQAGLRGDGGSDTNSAVDIRVIKALLLNGAVKAFDWTNAPAFPLDARWGAGVLDVFNSYEQLIGGRQTNFVSTTVAAGAAHPPVLATNTIGASSGWDFETIASSVRNDAVNHYFFDVTNTANDGAFAATATLAWNRQAGQSAINVLNLFLYNAANGNLVLCSTSQVDNVQEIFVPRLAQGRYDLEVWKAGGLGDASQSETYALAFEFSEPMLSAQRSGRNVLLSWPLYPDGFLVESTTNLAAPENWTTNLPAPVLTNDQNEVLAGVTNAAQFFRLRTP